MAKKQGEEVNKILKDIRDKKLSPIYFLTGDEPYYIDELSSFIEKNVLSEEEKDFNLSVLYGSDTNILNILATAKRYPIMAKHQVVVIREAQGIPDFNSKIDILTSYAKNPQASTVLVFCYKYKKVDGRKPFLKQVKKTGVYFESKKKYENELPSWIDEIIRKSGYKIEPKSTLMLVEYLGNDLNKISKELDKLMNVVDKKTIITPAHIEEYIGISKEFNNFELSSAIASKDILKANKIVNFFTKNPKDNPILATIPLIFNFFSKLLILHSLKDKTQGNVAKELGVHPFFVKEYFDAAKNYNLRKSVRVIAYLREADMRAKGVGANAMPQGEILKELVYKILH